MADLLAARSARSRMLGGVRRRRIFPRRTILGGLAAAFTAVALAGCQEKLTAPGDCPDLCPGGQLTVIDTILDAIPNGDSSFVGYVAPGTGQAILVSSGLPGSEDRAVVRFAARPESVFVNGILRAYTVDSAAIEFLVHARDTAVNVVRVALYRLPADVDSTTTFADVEPELVNANVIDTVPIAADSVNFVVRTVISGAALAQLAIPGEDDGVLAIGMRLVAAVPTGLRIGTFTLGTAPMFTSYVAADTGGGGDMPKQTLARGAAFSTFVSQGTPAFDPDLLSVGGEPSARALIRFNFPPKLRDSVSIVRATLEVVPVSPFLGLTNDPTSLEARALLSDLGAKSPLCTLGGVCGSTFFTSPPLVELEQGSADTVRLEVPQVVRSWQGINHTPSAMFLIVRPEAATFMRPVFFSTRSGSGAPRLRLSYVPLFPSGSP